MGRKQVPLCLATCLLVSLPTLAAADWSAVTVATVLYTDNVFELSSSRRFASRRRKIPANPNRGVVDTTHLGPMDVRYDLTKAASVTLGFQRSQRSSSTARTTSSIRTHR